MHFNRTLSCCILVLISSLAFSHKALAKIKVITTTTNARALVEVVGGNQVNVTSLTKGGQDPHHIEAKPSFMVKLARTNLLVSIGLGLESGWLPAVIKGSRNPKLKDGQDGSLVLGDFVEPLDRIHGDISREDGDVHPEGNPHFMLSPRVASELSIVVAKKLSEIAPQHSNYFLENAKRFQKSTSKNLKTWKKQVQEQKIDKIITYHKTLRYFLSDLGVTSVAQMEPKPGIPPSSSHLLYLSKVLDSEQIKTILIENYYNKKTAQKITAGRESIKVSSIPVAVDGAPGIENLIELYTHIVDSLIHKGAS